MRPMTLADPMDHGVLDRELWDAPCQFSNDDLRSLCGLDGTLDSVLNEEDFQ